MIYISLTTVPARLKLWDSLVQNLKSLLEQKTDLDFKVVLNIPYIYKKNNEPYVLPEELINLSQENPRLLINRVEDDKGPIVKILGCLDIASSGEDIIIVCDDDHVYHEEMLEYHYKKINEYSNSAIAFRGDLPVEKRCWVEDGTKKFVLRPTHFLFPVQTDSRLVIPGHWHSVSYKRSFFKEDFFKEEFLSGSINDDVLMGYYCKQNQISVICAKWDKEEDWRPVNQLGRGGYSFPIVYSLPYPESGFYEFRQVTKDSQGRIEPFISNVIENYEVIYIEKI